VKLRFLVTAAAAAGLIATMLTGCQTNVGAAAFVGNHKISVSQVSDWTTVVTPEQATATGASVADLTSGARRTVVFNLVREQLFDQVFDKQGNRPTQSELDAKHDASIQQIFGSQGVDVGEAGDAALVAGLKSIGIDGGFGKIWVRSWELELVLADRIGATSEAEVAQLIQKLGIKVSVSDRYGSWDSSTLNLTATGPASYLHSIAGTAAATS
jgi:hypothetical protein